MKKKVLKVTALICVIGISMIWFACQKESEIIGKGEVSFNISSQSVSELKSTQSYDLNNADKVILTVQENDGSPTDYTQYELNIHKMGNAFITKKIALQFGAYKVTEFYIIDALDSVIYASPLEGSLMAQNVTDPIPVLFNVTEKQSRAVEIEVISTKNLKPEDFGLIRFPIVEIKTFQFLINVSELGTDQLLIADLTITNGSYSYSQKLDSIVDNIVTIKDGYESYILTIESIGYQAYIDTLTNTELKYYESIPLIVEIEKITIPTEGLVAHYPFNGNANDESENGNDGTNYGATLVSDRFGNPNSAYQFDAVDDYINIPSDFLPTEDTPRTFALWVNPTDISDESILFQYGNNSTRGLNRITVESGYFGFRTYYDDHITSYEVMNNYWSHLCIVYDGSAQLNYYLNGNKIDVYNLNGNLNTIIGYYSESIGGGGRLGTSGTFSGIIDDFYIYNRALTETEIQLLYSVNGWGM